MGDAYGRRFAAAKRSRMGLARSARTSRNTPGRRSKHGVMRRCHSPRVRPRVRASTRTSEARLGPYRRGWLDAPSGASGSPRRIGSLRVACPRKASTPCPGLGPGTQRVSGTRLGREMLTISADDATTGMTIAGSFIGPCPARPESGVSPMAIRRCVHWPASAGSTATALTRAVEHPVSSPA
jgi:hypothetical protein